jgi:hypothetical protein
MTKCDETDQMAGFYRKKKNNCTPENEVVTPLIISRIKK